MNEKLSPLTSFVLPGGTALAAHLHLARAIARRAERAIVELAAQETDQSRSAALCQPAVGPSVRDGAHRQ